MWYWYVIGFLCIVMSMGSVDYGWPGIFVSLAFLFGAFWCLAMLETGQ